MMLRKYRNVILVIILLISVVFIQFHSDLLFTTSFQVAFNDIVYASTDGEGSQLIIDTSGQRLLKINEEQEVEFVVKGGQKSGKGFYEAKRVLADDENQIYVLNIIKEDGGYRVEREEILEYSPSGEYIGIVCEIEHENPVMVEQIAGLYIIDGSLAYLVNNQDSFSIFNKENELLKEYSFEGAADLNISYALHPDTQEVYYSTKQGRILKLNEAGEDTLLYDASNAEYLSIPREITFDPEGNLYFADIGLRAISMIDPEGQLSQVIYDGVVGEDIASKFIYYYANADYGLITVSSYYIASVQNGEIIYDFDASFSAVNRTIIIADWVAAVIALLISIYLLFKLVILIFTKGHKTFRLALCVVVGVACIAGVFLLIVLPDFENRLIDAELQRAQMISDITEMILPVEEYQRLDSTSDYMSEDYKAVRDKINDLYLSNSEGISDFYCVLYTIRDGAITCTYSLQEDTGAIYPYDWEYEGSDEQEIIKTGIGKVYKGLTTSEGNYLFVLNPIYYHGNIIGLVEVGTDLNSFHKETNTMIFELMLNVIVITIVVILIALEFIIFLHGRSEFLKNKEKHKEGTLVTIPYELLRILVFGIFFITNITTSFLPLYAMEIAQSEAALAIPKEVLAAVPISAEVLFGAIFSLMGNSVIRRFGYKKSAVLSSILITLGLFIRLLLPNIWILTLGNSIMGSGWGILLLIVNTMIAKGNEDEKNQGFAGYSAAALNGVNCGIVFGGFLVNWFSHTAIFLFAVVLSLFLIVHVVVYLMKGTYQQEDGADAEATQAMSLIGFLASRGVMKFFLMIVLPVIACGYFLNFLFPILGSEYGLSESRIGYAFLINGLCVICFSNLLTEYFAKKVKKVYSLVVAALLYAIAFFCVAYFQNIYSLLAVLVLFGLSDSFGLPLQTSYYTDLEAVKKYGYEKSMGIYSLFENIAQSGGSFIFSYVLIIGVSKGLTIVLAIVAILAVLFGILHFFQGRMKKFRIEPDQLT